jgi:hypothetical protein
MMPSLSLGASTPGRAHWVIQRAISPAASSTPITAPPSAPAPPASRGWPELARCTASMASVRMVSIQA